MLQYLGLTYSNIKIIRALYGTIKTTMIKVDEYANMLRLKIHVFRWHIHLPVNIMVNVKMEYV